MTSAQHESRAVKGPFFVVLCRKLVIKSHEGLIFVLNIDFFFFGIL